MSRSIWFWVVAILLVLMLWAGRNQISSYFAKLPMAAQKRTTNTQLLASATPRPATQTPQPKSRQALKTLMPTRRPVTPTPSFASYVVQTGDTLYSIANVYKTSVTTLQRINGIQDASALYVGQKLKVPSRPQPAKTAMPAAPVARAGTQFYTVLAGDTLSSIARKFHVSMAELQTLNTLPNPNNLVVGSKILIPAAKITATVSVAPTGVVAVDTEVHALPVLQTPAAGSLTTPVPPRPAETPTPTPIPTMPSVCNGLQEAVFVWGVSFCVPDHWTLQEYAQPYRTALLTKRENGGNVSLYAISRLDGSPNAPLSWSMRQARNSVSTEIASLIPGGIETPDEWGAVAKISIAHLSGQSSEATTKYLKSGERARVQVIVFNHENQRWRIVMLAPESLWNSYKAIVYPYIANNMETF